MVKKKRKHSSLKCQWYYCVFTRCQTKDFILTINKYNFILKILLDQNARSSGIYEKRKKDRAEDCSSHTSWGYSLVSHSIWQLQGRSHAVLLGRLVAGHQLVLLCLWFIFFDSSFFFLSDCSFCFLCSHPLGLPTAVSGTGSQQSALLSQSLLSRLFNCAEDHVTSILPNNNSLWVICS